MNKKEESASSYLAAGVSFRGKAKFYGEFINNGFFEGSVEGDKLTQESEGKIDGKLQVKEFVNHGFFRGEASCDRLLLKKDSDTEGNIKAEEVLVESGGNFKIQLKDQSQINRFD